MQARSSPTAAWVVVLEFSSIDHPEAQPTIGEVVEMLEALDPGEPVSLYDIDRYAVQVRIEATSAARALAHAMAKHARSVAQLGLAPLPLARADVMTPDELARDLDAAATKAPGSWTIPVYGQN